MAHIGLLDVNSRKIVWVQQYPLSTGQVENIFDIPNAAQFGALQRSR